MARHAASGRDRRTRPIAAAIASTPSTRNPVTPSSTISGSAPRAIRDHRRPGGRTASIATSELVSGARLGTSRQRAPASRSAFRAGASAPRKRCRAGPQSRRGTMLLGKVGLVLGVREDLPADPHRQPRRRALHRAPHADSSPDRPVPAPGHTARGDALLDGRSPPSSTPFAITSGASSRESKAAGALARCVADTQTSRVFAGRAPHISPGYQASGMCSVTRAGSSPGNL